MGRNEFDDETDDELEAKGAKFRLHDIRVESVDLVDRPANQRRFLVVKREESPMPKQDETLESRPPAGAAGAADATVEVADPESGTPGAAPASAGNTDTDGATPEGTAAAGAEAGNDPGDGKGKPEPISKVEIAKAAEAHAALLKEKIAAIQKIADDLATNAGTMDAADLKAKICQLEQIGWKIDDPATIVNVMKSEGGAAAGSEVAKAIPTPVRDAVVKTLREATERLMSVVQALKTATVTQDKSPTPLPDPVFRELKAVATLLKSILQRYPYPSPAGAAKAEGDPEDVTLESAIELMKQAAALTIPAPVRDAVAGSVREAAEVILSIMQKIQGMPTTDEQTSTPLPAETAGAIGKVLTVLEGVVEKYPAPAAKSDAAMTELDKAFDAIRTVVRGFAQGEIVVKSEAPPAASDPQLAEIAKAVKANADAIAALTGKIEKRDATPGASNALEDTGGDPDKVAKGARIEWPTDLAEDIAKGDKGNDGKE